MDSIIVAFLIVGLVVVIVPSAAVIVLVVMLAADARCDTERDVAADSGAVDDTYLAEHDIAWDRGSAKTLAALGGAR